MVISPEKNRRKIRYYTTMDDLFNVLGVAISLGLFYGAPILSFLLCLALYCSSLSPVLLAYFIWMYLDRNTPHRDGRRSDWVCSLWIYRRCRKYFPHSVVKTVDLSSDRNYLMCLFPHGIVVTSIFAQFIPNQTSFARLFPNLKSTMHTLNSNFLLPFLREYSLFSGLLAVSREALLHQLNKTPRGRAVVLVPGGSAEAMVSQPGSHRLVLKTRKGFIKLAILSGASLVPIYVFGETDLYDHYLFPKTSVVYHVQRFLRKMTGVAFVVLNGGGFLQDRFGLLPRPQPVVAVVGEPINVPKNPNPSDDDVKELHAKFIAKLIRLFEDNKHRFLDNAVNAHLSIEECYG